MKDDTRLLSPSGIRRSARQQLLEACIVYLSCCCDKISKNDLRKDGSVLAHSLRVLSVMVGNPQQQELEAAAHGPTIRKETERNAGAQVTFPFNSAQNRSQRSGASATQGHLGQILPR